MLALKTHGRLKALAGLGVRSPCTGRELELLAVIEEQLNSGRAKA